MDKKDILNYSLEELEKELIELNFKKYNAKQIFMWLHKELEFDFDNFTNISKENREILKEKFTINNMKQVGHQKSMDGSTQKFLFKLDDGKLVESVIIGHKNRVTLCVSSQVGCALKCDFCATGTMKFEKNLKASEIIMQLYYAQKHLLKDDSKITNVVYMGMGEPFLNYKEVVKSINLLASIEGQQMSKRSFTVSTAGLADKIHQFADDEKQVNLALSLHAVKDETRNEIMPINRRYNIEKLKEELLYYQKTTNNRIMFEYILIDNFNCEKEDILPLVHFLKNFNCIVNLIPYNHVVGKPYTTPSKDKQRAFYEGIVRHKINATLRETKGQDIAAACGQLKVKNTK